MASKSNQVYKKGEPTIVSSFYSSPDGTNAVRFYEIENTNKEIKKLPKYSLEELRVENFSSDLFHNFVNFFRRKPANYNIGNKEFLDKTNQTQTLIDKDNSNDIQTAPQTYLNTTKQSTHFTSNGGVLKVTAFDLTKNKDTDFALQDLMRRQEIGKSEATRTKSQSQFNSPSFDSINNAANKRRSINTSSQIKSNDMIAQNSPTFTASRDGTNRKPNQIINNDKLSFYHNSPNLNSSKNILVNGSKYTEQVININSSTNDQLPPYLTRSPKSLRRNSKRSSVQPLSSRPYGLPVSSVALCNCLECQAKLRSAGVINGQCNCIDCMAKRKAELSRF